MAIVKTGHRRTDSYLAFEQESTFGTAVTDGSNFILLDTVNGDTPGFNRNFYLDERARNHQKLLADISDFNFTENGQWQTYQIPQTYAPADVLANLLYGALQTVSEAAGSPYLKTYTVDGTADPDFSSNAGFFFTLLVKEPFASFSKKLTSCVMRTLTIGLSAENGGRIWLSGEAITGQGYTGTSNPSGTNAYSSVSVPNFHDSNASTLAIDSLDCVWYSAELRIENTIDWVGYSSGAADNYKLVDQKITGNFVVKLDTNTDALTNVEGSLTSGSTILTIGSSGSAGYFKFDSGSSTALFRRVTAIRGGDSEVQKINIEMEFRPDYAGAEQPVFYVADGVDQTW